MEWSTKAPTYSLILELKNGTKEHGEALLASLQKKCFLIYKTHLPSVNSESQIPQNFGFGSRGQGWTWSLCSYQGWSTGKANFRLRNFCLTRVQYSNDKSWEHDMTCHYNLGQYSNIDIHTATLAWHLEPECKKRVLARQTWTIDMRSKTCDLLLRMHEQCAGIAVQAYLHIWCIVLGPINL